MTRNQATIEFTELVATLTALDRKDFEVSDSPADIALIEDLLLRCSAYLSQLDAGEDEELSSAITHVRDLIATIQGNLSAAKLGRMARCKLMDEYMEIIQCLDFVSLLSFHFNVQDS